MLRPPHKPLGGHAGCGQSCSCCLSAWVGPGVFSLLALKCAGGVVGQLFPLDIAGALGSVWFFCISKEEHLFFCSSCCFSASLRLLLTQTSTAETNCEA